MQKPDDAGLLKNRFHVSKAAKNGDWHRRILRACPPLFVAQHAHRPHE
jgi:hypothetical protein